MCPSDGSHSNHKFQLRCCSRSSAPRSLLWEWELQYVRHHQAQVLHCNAFLRRSFHWPSSCPWQWLSMRNMLLMDRIGTAKGWNYRYDCAPAPFHRLTKRHRMVEHLLIECTLAWRRLLAEPTEMSGCSLHKPNNNSEPSYGLVLQANGNLVPFHCRPCQSCQWYSQFCGLNFHRREAISACSQLQKQFRLTLKKFRSTILKFSKQMKLTFDSNCAGTSWDSIQCIFNLHQFTRGTVMIIKIFRGYFWGWLVRNFKIFRRIS